MEFSWFPQRWDLPLNLYAHVFFRSGDVGSPLAMPFPAGSDLEPTAATK